MAGQDFGDIEGEVERIAAEGFARWTREARSERRTGPGSRIVDGPDAVHRRSIARREPRRERPFAE